MDCRVIVVTYFSQTTEAPVPGAVTLMLSQLSLTHMGANVDNFDSMLASLILRRNSNVFYF